MYIVLPRAKHGQHVAFRQVPAPALQMLRMLCLNPQDMFAVINWPTLDLGEFGKSEIPLGRPLVLEDPQRREIDMSSG